MRTEEWLMVRSMDESQDKLVTGKQNPYIYKQILYFLTEWSW